MRLLQQLNPYQLIPKLSAETSTVYNKFFSRLLHR